MSISSCKKYCGIFSVVLLTAVLSACGEGETTTETAKTFCDGLNAHGTFSITNMATTAGTPRNNSLIRTASFKMTIANFRYTTSNGRTSIGEYGGNSKVNTSEECSVTLEYTDSTGGEGKIKFTYPDDATKGAVSITETGTNATGAGRFTKE